MQNGGNLTSVSEACVFFYRPDFIDNGSGGNKDISAGVMPRPDGQHEFASLYNPYWQARLTAADPKWTTLLYAAIKLPGLDAALNAQP